MNSTFTTLLKIFGNAAVFVTAYFIFLIPTYLLPYLGSNSTVAIATSSLAGVVTLPLMGHLICLLGLIIVTLLRGCVVKKIWIVLFPCLAAVFDLFPGLSWIPLLPSLMHIITLVLGLIFRPALSATAGARNA